MPSVSALRSGSGARACPAWGSSGNAGAPEYRRLPAVWGCWRWGRGGPRVLRARRSPGPGRAGTGPARAARYRGGHSGEFCGHAKGQLSAVVQAAIDAGFSTYGLSEHAPRFHVQHLYPEEAGLVPADLARTFERYVRTALELRERHADRLELLIGFETEALPVESWVAKMRKLRESAPFDYIVGSVH